MPMKRDEHESLLNELLDGEIEHSRKTEILQQLRADYSNVHSEFEDVTSKNEKLSSDNQDLIVSNSKLFRQIGVTGTEKEKEVEEKEFSEQITIEDIERG